MEPKNKTLFIWDESHFAQDQGMCPDKFFEQMGIILNGDWMPLRERDNYVLSVSATSFSEASNAIHQDQSKAVVTFSPSPAYMSIKKMKENGMIGHKLHTFLKENMVLFVLDTTLDLGMKMRNFTR